MNFLSGSYFKHQCRYQIGDYSDARNFHLSSSVDTSKDNNLIFVKTELLSQFLQLLNNNRLDYPKSFSLVLHNSDINFYLTTVTQVLQCFPDVEKLYTQNLLVQHPNVFPIPIGLANPKWSHGNINRFKKIASESIEKTNDVYINFNIATNPKERNYCLEKIGERPRKYPNFVDIEAHNKFIQETQEEYLRDIKRSYFVVSPDGNGRDCHKTWESIYMGSIPIVTNSYFARRFKEIGVPLTIINDWSEYKNLELSKELFEDTWKDFNINNLSNLFI
jgi:hypothetical protein